MIVSEERGEVSLAIDQEIKKVKNQTELSQLLQKEMFKFQLPEKDFKKKIKSWITTRYQVKLSVSAMVFIFWLVLAGQQNFEKRVDLPLTLRNIPPQIVVAQPIDPKISITLRGLRKDVTLLNNDNINSYIDLFSARLGTSFYNINVGNLTLPNDRVHVVKITPSKFEFVFEKKDNPVQNQTALPSQ